MRRAHVIGALALLLPAAVVPPVSAHVRRGGVCIVTRTGANRVDGCRDSGITCAKGDALVAVVTMGRGAGGILAVADCGEGAAISWTSNGQVPVITPGWATSDGRLSCVAVPWPAPEPEEWTATCGVVPCLVDRPGTMGFPFPRDGSCDEPKAGYGTCAYDVVRDVTDPGGLAWIGLAELDFEGLPDVTHFEVECWLQADETYGVGEIANTRARCEESRFVGACWRPTTFERDVADVPVLYQCTRVEWTDANLVGLVDHLQQLDDHALRDAFSTGGITTLGPAQSVVATSVQAGQNAVATAQNARSPVPRTVTNQVDHDPDTAGVQCYPIST